VDQILIWKNTVFFAEVRDQVGYLFTQAENREDKQIGCADDKEEHSFSRLQIVDLTEPRNDRKGGCGPRVVSSFHGFFLSPH